jgi:hypothetical protein
MHHGPTLGYRVEADCCSVCYIPDQKPGLGASLAVLDDDWISGPDLARGLAADPRLPVHRRQYPSHVGWGHSSLSDALVFGHRAGAERLLLFHHDPLHTTPSGTPTAGAWWSARELEKPAHCAKLAVERREIEPAPASQPTRA